MPEPVNWNCRYFKRIEELSIPEKQVFLHPGANYPDCSLFSITIRKAIDDPKRGPFLESSLDPTVKPLVFIRDLILFVEGEDIKLPAIDDPKRGPFLESSLDPTVKPLVFIRDLILFVEGEDIKLPVKAGEKRWRLEGSLQSSGCKVQVVFDYSKMGITIPFWFTWYQPMTLPMILGDQTKILIRLRLAKYKKMIRYDRKLNTIVLGQEAIALFKVKLMKYGEGAFYVSFSNQKVRLVE
ncbi:hypothetical protein ABG067_005541 [Albugo candida]